MRNIDALRKRSDEKKDNLIRKVLLYLALVPVLALLIICDIFYYEIKDIQSQYQTEVDSIQERKVNVIYSLIMSRREQGLIQNRYIITSIKKQLSNTYSNNESLKYDLLTRSSPFVSICSNAINKDMEIVKEYTDISSRAESVFVCDKYGIISDTGYVEKAIENRSWGDEINHKKNRVLTDNAIYMLSNQNKDIIFWESDKNVSDYINPSFVLEEPNNYTLLELIRKNNIYVLKNFNVLIPSYITDTGDIFGVPDVDEHGLPNDNNKIIVVREINMFDIVAPYIDGLQQYDIIIDRYTMKTDDFIRSKTLTYLVLAVICILFFIFIMVTLDGRFARLQNPRNRGDTNDNDTISQ